MAEQGGDGLEAHARVDGLGDECVAELVWGDQTTALNTPRGHSARVRAQLRRDGHMVSKKTVEASMARQGLQGRAPKRRRRGLTRADKAAAPVPDLLRRDFSAQCRDR